jgi:RNA polymerase sigma-70 factor (sigma-E family)
VKAEQERDFVEYVTGRMPVLRRVATQLAGDAHRGDDLVQQAIAKLYTYWRRASRVENLDAYVYRILVRVFLDERRHSWSQVRLADTPADRPAPRAVDDVENRLLLRAALAQLPPRQRAAVVLRFLADRSVEEAAEILGVTPGTVKSQTSDGLARLRRLLAASADRPGVLS